MAQPLLWERNVPFSFPPTIRGSSHTLVPLGFLLNPHPSWAGHLASVLVELGEAKLLGITQMYPGLAL